MPVPDFPFLADDVYWPEVPIIIWLAGMTIVMLVLNLRFGWSRARDILVSRRMILAGTLAVAVVLAVVLYVSSDQPMATYF